MKNIIKRIIIIPIYLAYYVYFELIMGFGVKDTPQIYLLEYTFIIILLS